MKKHTALLAFLFVLFFGLSANAAPKADYIFYFIGDGMGMGPSMAAQLYNKNVLGNAEPLPMFQAPYGGWLQTYSASADVTDSAAAGTALATGHKTKNGMLGMTPDSVAVDAVTAPLHKHGYGIGIVTSVDADDATPGAFVAHAPSRKDYRPICGQMAVSGFEFIAGASLRGAYTDGKPNDVFGIFEENGVQVLMGPSGLDSIESRKVLVLGDRSRRPYFGLTYDSVPGALTLPMLTEACISHLEKYSPAKFFAMIEGGNIDHCLHGNDGGQAIKEIMDFNRSIAMAIEFYKKHPENTLIVITADHDTGGMAYLRKDNSLRYVDSQKISKDVLSDFCKSRQLSKESFGWEDMKKYLDDNMGLYSTVKLSKKQKQAIRDAFTETFEKKQGEEQQTLYASFHPFAVAVFEVFNQACGFAFTNLSHTANPVPLFVMGCGAENFHGVLNNNELAERILKAAGL